MMSLTSSPSRGTGKVANGPTTELHDENVSISRYTSDASSYPVWKYDSSGFYASTKGVDVYPPDPSGDILSFTVGTATGTTAFSGGVNPWYTIGH